MNKPKKSRYSSTPLPLTPNGQRISALITRPVPSFINLVTIYLSLQWESVESSRFGNSFGLDDPGFESRQLQEISCAPKSSRPAVELTQPSVQWVPV